MANVDVVAAVDIDKPKPTRRFALTMQDIDKTKPTRRFALKMPSLPAFDPYTVFGLLAWFIVLYGIYAGYFVMLYEIALAVRGTDYQNLSSKQQGSSAALGSYQLPWEVMAASLSGRR